MHSRIEPDTYFTVSALLAIISYFVLPVKKIIYSPYSFSGIALIIAGLVLVSRTNRLLIKNKTALKTFENPEVLVTSGPFGFSRNPIYLGMVIILFGIVIIPGTLFPFSFPLLFFFIIDRAVIPFEEKNLEKSFGQQYNEYKKRVRRWL
ncbi:MAG TPA: isoprenylcysteine carboxylmethyltransferase family protein [Bacteroidales bacterium]|nr:isoprenylcysteine carboxylmethyltransferase family protein [Bacteroidales bacterium]